ncbi:MAG: septation regulator SpoVG [Fusobacteriaceae bacterium]
MKITDIRLKMVTEREGELKLKAYADVTFDESFVVHGLKVIDGEKGMFVAMPSRKMVDGEYKDVAHPIKPELRKEITDTIIAKLNQIKVSLKESEYSSEENQKKVDVV